MSRFQKRTYTSVPVGQLDVNNIAVDPTEIKNTIGNTSDFKNFNIGYDDHKSLKGQCVKFQSTFMLLPYGISAYSPKDQDKNAKPSYTMTVGFQHSPDEKTKYNAEKFDLIQQSKVEKLAEQMKKMDVSIMSKLLENAEFKAYFFKLFGKTKLKKIDPENPDVQEIVDILMPTSSSYNAYDADEDPEQKKYPYDVMKVRVIYGNNPETNTRKYYINMVKIDPQSGDKITIKEEDYEEIFGSELRGCVARFQYQPQFWILGTGEKKCGIKYVLKEIQYIPFKSAKPDGMMGQTMEEDDEETDLMKRFAKTTVSTKPTTSNEVEEVGEDDAQEVSSEEEVEEEDEEEDDEEEVEEETETVQEEPKKRGRRAKVN